MEVIPDRKPEVETRKSLAVNTDNFTETHAAKPATNVTHNIPFIVV